MVVTRTNLTTRRHVGRRAPVSLIAIHTMEAPEAAQTAENVANYFKRVDASAHWCVDNDSRVRVVKDEDTAWTLPGANSRSLNIEIAGYASRTLMTGPTSTRSTLSRSRRCALPSGATSTRSRSASSPTTRSEAGPRASSDTSMQIVSTSRARTGTRAPASHVDLLPRAGLSLCREARAERSEARGQAAHQLEQQGIL